MANHTSLIQLKQARKDLLQKQNDRMNLHKKLKEFELQRRNEISKLRTIINELSHPEGDFSKYYIDLQELLNAEILTQQQLKQMI